MAARIKWNPTGLYQLRSDPGIVAELEKHAGQVQARAESNGRGRYEMGSQQGAKRPQGRWRTSVVTADGDAMKDNAENNTLLKALRGGGD